VKTPADLFRHLALIAKFECAALGLDQPKGELSPLDMNRMREGFHFHLLPAGIDKN